MKEFEGSELQPTHSETWVFLEDCNLFNVSTVFLLGVDYDVDHVLIVSYCRTWRQSYSV